VPSDSPGPRAAPAPAKVQGAVRGTSLALRIALVAVLSAVIAVLVAGFVSYPLARDAAIRQTESNLEKLTDATAAALERAPTTPDVDGQLIPDRLLAILEAENITAYYVLQGAQLPEGLTQTDLDALLAGQNVHGERVTHDGQIFVSARQLGSGAAVVLTQSDNAVNNLAISALYRFGIALAIGAAIAAVFGLLLARRLTRPLRQASHAARRLSTGDRDVVLKVEGPPEIAELTVALNDLQQALAVSEGRQRDFLLSVSHELRTPLTAIRGYAEAIADGVVPPSQMASTGVIMSSESDRLDRLVSDLLELARLDASDFPINPVPLNFQEIGNQAVAVWSDRCSSEGLTLLAELPVEPLYGRSDPVRIRQIIDNLCANALRVTPEGQVIVIAVRPADRRAWGQPASAHFVELEVRDGGPGLTADDCQVAFEPAELYSRYRGFRKVGTGVGLALVARLARRLGGGAEAGAAPEGGARFTIRVARWIDY